jgi:ribonuclease HI
MTPPTGPVFIHTDGSVLGSTHEYGPSATIGYVIEQDDQTLLEGSRTITTQTTSSNTAEYIALAHALDQLAETTTTPWVFIRTDSQNLVDLLNGDSPRSTVSGNWLETIQQTLTQFAGHTISKAPRHSLQRAHYLARTEHDAPTAPLPSSQF